MSEKGESTVPRSIGIIMDGNRRWAKAQGLQSYEGHRAGYEKMKEVLGWAKEAGVETVITYAFSTENWKRDEKEVSFLMDLFRIFISSEKVKSDTRVQFIGDRARMPQDICDAMATREEETKHNTPFTIAVALSYGGRDEIVHALQGLVAQSAHGVSEADVQKNLYTHDIVDPDLIIRTGGEKRLSNFLLWQSAYSELFFIDTPWPAFSKHEFEDVLSQYVSRKRNFGA